MTSRTLCASLLTAAFFLPFAPAGATSIDAGMPARNAAHSAVTNGTALTVQTEAEISPAAGTPDDSAPTDTMDNPDAGVALPPDTPVSSPEADDEVPANDTATDNAAPADTDNAAPADTQVEDGYAAPDDQSMNNGDAAGAVDVTAAQAESPGDIQQEDAYASSHTVADIRKMSVIGADGKKLGNVEQLVTGKDEETYAVVKSKGFLGLGRKQVLVPVDVMTVDTADGKVVLSGTSSLNGYTAFDEKNYSRLSDNKALNTLDLQYETSERPQVETR